jgi:hypothetical protein
MSLVLAKGPRAQLDRRPTQLVQLLATVIDAGIYHAILCRSRYQIFQQQSTQLGVICGSMQLDVVWYWYVQQVTQVVETVLNIIEIV